MSDSPQPRDGRRQEPTGDLSASVPAAAASDVTLRRVGDALRGLRYGSVVAIVQDGVVVQIERTEKTRFGR
jgi:hypothetical protein